MYSKSNESIKKASLKELLEEVGERLKINHGKIQAVFHQGRLTEYLNLDHRLKINESEFFNHKPN